MRTLIALLVIFGAVELAAQGDWSWQERAPLPEATTNNAVCGAAVNGDDHVYSFGGIGSGLDRTAIHRKAYRYSTAMDEWTTLPELPDTSGKIASAASVVGGIAYVIGGYHVLAGSPWELSSDRVHRLDLATETWLSDGAAIPVPIDDQVQAVWRDSLIYVVTGWSNNTNVAAVQIYDPALDQWTAGTALPNNNLYKVFGASGTIIGDTIYYYGGASLGSNFPAQDELRIGVIDAEDPATITWSPAISTGRARYRTGCGSYADRPFWVGGSAVSYNYDAIAYNGSGVVQPSAELAVHLADGAPLQVFATPEAVMDLRGLGDLSGGGFHVCGGIGADGEVLATNWLVQATVDITEGQVLPAHVYPNPSTGVVHVELLEDARPDHFIIRNALGQTIRTGNWNGSSMTLDLGGETPGAYMLQLFVEGTVRHLRFWIR